MTITNSLAYFIALKKRWRQKIIVASATGVAQLFYHRFAEYAVQKGFEVLTFDYRGVALSASSIT